ncbi:hypothetical protein HDR63_03940 [bacterium]|nr:hypothetical protein [bacterium]
MDHTLRQQTRAWVGGFVLNSVCVMAATAAVLWWDAGPAMARACGATGDADVYVTRGLMTWGVGGVLIFLIPALATHWARGRIIPKPKKHIK